MSITQRVFAKNILPRKLHEELANVIGPIFTGIQVVGDQVTIVLSQEPTTQQDQDILDTINNHVNTPTAASIEEDETKRRQTDGMVLYQKLYADLSLNETFATVDSSISGYDTLLKLRCMLKDGSGKTALRFLVKHVGPLNLFSADQLERFRLWTRDYCWEHRVSTYQGLDRASYDQVLDAVEQAENI